MPYVSPNMQFFVSILCNLSYNVSLFYLLSGVARYRTSYPMQREKLVINHTVTLSAMFLSSLSLSHAQTMSHHCIPNRSDTGAMTTQCKLHSLQLHNLGSFFG